MATSKVLKPRRGSTAEHSTFKGQAFEITFDTDKKTIVAHDGLTMGGFPLAHEAAVTETDSALRELIEQKVAEVEGVSSSELRALESALRGLINNQAQQQTARDADQDNVISALDSTLRALIAQEVAKYLSLGGGTLKGSLMVPNILRGQKDDTLGIYGGDAWREGAFLELSGPNAEYPDAFTLHCAGADIVGDRDGVAVGGLILTSEGAIESNVNNALSVIRGQGETIAVRAENTNVGKAVRFGVGASGARGIYDESSASWLISYSASGDRLMSKGANVHTSADGLLLNDDNVQLWWAAEATLPAGGTWKVIGFCSSQGSALDSTICNRYAGGSIVRMTKNSSEMFILAIRIA